MVLNGLINTRVLGICRDLNIDAVGISGVDAGLVRAHKRPPVKLGASGELIDFGFVGDIDAVDTTVLRKLLDNGLMPVVSPLSADETGMLLNINADTVAAAIGAALGAEKLILCTGAPGILGSVDDAARSSPIPTCAASKRLREEGRIADGMLPKAKAIEDALRGGVQPRARGFLPLAGGNTGRGVHQRGHRHADRRGRERAVAGRSAERAVTRLWDKGAPLDERVLRYTRRRGPRAR